MNDVTSATMLASASDQLADAVEKTVVETFAKVTAASAKTPAEKQIIAHGIYTVWRNNNLSGISPQAFAQVEASSAALINAIAAQL